MAVPQGGIAMHDWQSAALHHCGTNHTAALPACLRLPACLCLPACPGTSKPHLNSCMGVWPKWRICSSTAKRCRQGKHPLR